MAVKKVYIILVNWNGWQDTLECLESVFRNDYPNYRLIICDNDSSDCSLEKIRSWARDELSFHSGENGRFHRNATESLPKPIPFAEFDRRTAEETKTTSDLPLVLINTGGNLGFAGGNNVALRYVLARGDGDYVWLLNNDTVIEPGALAALVRRMEERPDAGMCGSTILYYDTPGIIWAQGGGTLNLWLAKSNSLGHGMARDRALPQDHVERHMDYVAGASILVSRRFLEQVGLMSEDYFLYFEEPDWAFRGKEFRLLYAPDSVVYHKVGTSTQLVNKVEHAYCSHHGYIYRSSLLFTSRFFPQAIPFVYLRCCFNRFVVWLVFFVRRTCGQC